MAANRPYRRRRSPSVRSDESLQAGADAENSVSQSNLLEATGSQRKKDLFHSIGSQFDESTKQRDSKGQSNFDVSYNSGRKTKVSDSDAKKTIQALVSSLNSSPMIGLPSNCNSHMARAVTAHGELSKQIEEFQKKLKEAIYANDQLKMQLDKSSPGPNRKSPPNSRPSPPHLLKPWRGAKGRSEQHNKSSDSPPVSPARSFRMPREYMKSLERRYRNSFSDRLKERTNSHLSSSQLENSNSSTVTQSKTDADAGSSISPKSQPGGVLWTMYHLAGLMGRLRGIHFDQAFFRLYQVFTDDVEYMHIFTNEINVAYRAGQAERNENLPPLTDLLEKASGLGRADPITRDMTDSSQSIPSSLIGETGEVESVVQHFEDWGFDRA